MKWSYTNGKLNVSSDDVDQQFTLQELIEEASRHQAYRKKIVALFLVISLILFFMQTYGGDIPPNASIYFYIGYLSTPLFISGFISSICYVLMRKPPRQLSILLNLQLLQLSSLEYYRQWFFLFLLYSNQKKKIEILR